MDNEITSWFYYVVLFFTFPMFSFLFVVVVVFSLSFKPCPPLLGYRSFTYHQQSV